jgi:type I restriction enzyme M protein
MIPFGWKQKPLEATKDPVLERKKLLGPHPEAEQDGTLRLATVPSFYNVGEFILGKLKASAADQRRRDDFIGLSGWRKSVPASSR